MQRLRNDPHSNSSSNILKISRLALKAPTKKLTSELNNQRFLAVKQTLTVKKNTELGNWSHLKVEEPFDITEHCIEAFHMLHCNERTMHF